MEIAALLLDHGPANLQALSIQSDGWTPLLLAAKVRVLLFLHSLIAVHSKDEADQRGHANVVALLIDRGADVNEQRSYDFTTALYAAAEVCRTCCTISIASLIAVQFGHKNVISLLLDRKADVHKAKRGGATPLWIAAEVCHIFVTLALPNSYQKCEQQSGFFDVVKRLIERGGADVDQATEKEWETPLFQAAEVYRLFKESVHLLTRCNTAE